MVVLEHPPHTLLLHMLSDNTFDFFHSLDHTDTRLNRVQERPLRLELQVDIPIHQLWEFKKILIRSYKHWKVALLSDTWCCSCRNVVSISMSPNMLRKEKNMYIFILNIWKEPLSFEWALLGGSSKPFSGCICVCGHHGLGTDFCHKMRVFEVENSSKFLSLHTKIGVQLQLFELRNTHIFRKVLDSQRKIIVKKALDSRELDYASTEVMKELTYASTWGSWTTEENDY